MTKLALRHCTPIKQGTKPISRSIALSLLKQLSPNWSFSADTKELQQEFSFKNFHETMGFVNAVAWIANTEDHHPDLKIGYNHCTVCFTTHAANGLTVNDFICAAKIDAIHISATEKTRALPETRSKTEIPTSTPQNIQLNMNEAEELLNIEIKAPEPVSRHDDDDYEIHLTDPDSEPTKPHLHDPKRTGKAIKNEAHDTSTEDEVFTDQNASAEDQEFMAATMILSPSSQIIHPRNSNHHDIDEDATIIVSPEESLDGDEWNPQPPNPTADPDEVKTMIVPGLKTTDAAAEEEEDNPDMMKTMIMKASDFGKLGKK